MGSMLHDTHSVHTYTWGKTEFCTLTAVGCVVCLHFCRFSLYSITGSHTSRLAALNVKDLGITHCLAKLIFSLFQLEFYNGHEIVLQVEKSFL